MDKKTAIDQLVYIFKFTEKSKGYLVKSAPGKLGYWTEVLVDIRFFPDVSIKGIRGTETQFLYIGDYVSFGQFSLILESTKVV